MEQDGGRPQGRPFLCVPGYGDRVIGNNYV